MVGRPLDPRSRGRGAGLVPLGQRERGPPPLRGGPPLGQPRPENKMLQLHESLSESLYQVVRWFGDQLGGLVR